MRLLIAATEVEASEQGAALLRRAHPQWNVHVCRERETCDELQRTDRWNVLVWDVGLGDCPRPVNEGERPAVVVAWCDPDEVSLLSDALSSGAAYHLVRTPGWQDYFVAVVTQASQGIPRPEDESEEQGASGEQAGRLVADAVDALVAPAIVVDAEGVILRQNAAFNHLIRRQPSEQLAGKHLTELLDVPDLLSPTLVEVLMGGQVKSVENALLIGEGQSMPCRATVVPLVNGEHDSSAVAILCERLDEAPELALGGSLGDGHLQALCEALRVLGTPPDLPTLLEACLDAAGEIVPFDVAVVVARDVEADEVVSATRGLSTAGVGGTVAAMRNEFGREHTASDGSLITVTSARRIEGPGGNESLRALRQEGEVQSGCYLPLVVNGQVLAALALGSRTAREFTESERASLTVFGTQAALVLAEVLLRRAAQRTAAFEHTLLELSLALNAGHDVQDILQLVANTALDVAHGTCCCIERLDEEQRRFERSCIAPSAGPCVMADQDGAENITWEAVETGDVAIARPAEGGDTGPIIAVPLTGDVGPIGVLRVRRERDAPFHSHEISALRLLAAQAAVAIRSAHLDEIARRRSHHMEVVAEQAWQEEARARALFEIATAVTERTQLQEILADVVRSACAEIGFERTQIYLADYEHQTLNGQLEARANAEPTPIADEIVPLRLDADNKLAQAALGSAAYMIDTVDDDSESQAKRYERLYVPLTTQNTLVGLIAASNPDSGEPVSPQRTRLLHSLAGLAGVAIERTRVDELRGTLISSVSHELRAPLASIRAYNELVMAGDAGEVNEEQATYLAYVERACKRLERVISDLMNLSKLRSGEVAIVRAPTDLRNLVEGVMDTMAPRAREAGVSLEFEVVDSLPPTMTDQGRVEQVLTNLVDNAIKFNEKGGRVEVKLSSHGSDALISVADDGPGIPKSQQAFIFDEFRHGTDEHTRAKEGAGLGLAIAKRVIEVVGGRLWVESESGQGSTFYVALPLETPED